MRYYCKRIIISVMSNMTKILVNRSLLLGSAAARLALVAVPLVLLWMAVAWALSLP
jgi:hypothetical protein